LTPPSKSKVIEKLPIFSQFMKGKEDHFGRLNFCKKKLTNMIADFTDSIELEIKDLRGKNKQIRSINDPLNSTQVKMKKKKKKSVTF
jgi:hypothetical protein